MTEVEQQHVRYEAPPPPQPLYPGTPPMFRVLSPQHTGFRAMTPERRHPTVQNPSPRSKIPAPPRYEDVMRANVHAATVRPQREEAYYPVF